MLCDAYACGNYSEKVKVIFGISIVVYRRVARLLIPSEARCLLGSPIERMCLRQKTIAVLALSFTSHASS